MCSFWALDTNQEVSKIFLKKQKEVKKSVLQKKEKHSLHRSHGRTKAFCLFNCKITQQAQGPMPTNGSTYTGPLAQ